MKAYTLSSLLVVIMIFLLGVVLFLLLWPVRVAEFHTPYKMSAKTVEANNVISYTADYCKFLPFSASVNRTLVNESVLFLPETPTNLATGCHKISVPILIPANAPPGTYHLRIALTYKVNFLREQTYVIESEPFEVTNGCLTTPKECK